MKNFRITLFTIFVLSALLASPLLALASAPYSDPVLDAKAHPFYIIEPSADPMAVSGYSPAELRAAYNLPASGGSGTIAIIDAFDAPSAQSDLDTFSAYFGLPTANYEEHHMASIMTTDSDWATETALDIEWAHAIAPDAKILLVQAESDFVRDLLDAVDYATSRLDVVAVSMSWGTDEFFTETSYDYRFTSTHNNAFFASSGDSGAGVMWPACSVNVVAVGGTTLTLGSGGTVTSETSWSGSGGGVSTYVPRPTYQTDYGVTYSRRAVPDVSYNANPATGFAIYYNGAWARVGGTSAGAPQWAAIHALGLTSSNTNIYQAAKSSSNSSYFRDITSGNNGAYSAAVGYDLVTGVGSPLTTNFKMATTTNTSITLAPAGQSSPLSPDNQFTITYNLNGTLQTANLQNGTATITSDSHTNLQISGNSTASTADEKWVFTQNITTVNVAAGTTSTLYYYDLLAQSSTYAVSGGGNPPSANVTYITAPTAASGLGNTQTTTQALSQTLPLTIWALRGTTTTTTNPIAGGVSEQWTTQPSNWTITGANQVPNPIAYTHQFQLNVTGAQPAGLQWFNSGDTANFTVQGVFNRTSGTGQRVAFYTLDGVTTPVTPSANNFTIAVQANITHQLQVNTTRQYQVVLDSSAPSMISSITTPTISGDSYWYDEGTPVHLALNAVANRTAGTGSRLTAYTLNGVLTNVTATAPVDVLNLSAIAAPQAITAAIALQYQFSLPTGSVNSLTPPTLQNDTGWYDSGASVTVQYNYTWNNTAESRTNALSYTINEASPTPLPRQATGTFQVQLTMNESKTVNVASTQQYLLNVKGGNNVTLSLTSPTSDRFFDAGTTLTASSDYTWNIVNGTSRQTLTAYTLDGATTNVTAPDQGTFTTPTITFSNPHTLAFNAMIQYLAVFQFTDAADAQTITPSTFQLNTSRGTFDVPAFQTWLNAGTQFQISSIIWQGTEVKPNTQATYIADAPLNVTVNCNIYNATLVVQNPQGAPVAGAQVAVTLANQTVINAVTDSSGTVDLPMIPGGTFTAAITYLGTTTTVSGNAASQPITTQAIPTTPSPSPSPTLAASTSPSPSQPATNSPSPAPSPTPAIPEIASPVAILALMVLVAALALAYRKRTAQK